MVKSSREVSPSASSPSTNIPAFWQSRSARTRLVTWAIGIRAAVPAEVRQAVAVTPAERRVGSTMPWAPKATAERMTAPRLRGSVTPSSATSSGVAVDCADQVQQVRQLVVGEGRHLQGDALVQDAAGAPVDLGPAHFQDRQAPVRGQLNRLGDPLVRLDPDRDVQRVGRDRRPAAPRPPGCGRPPAPARPVLRDRPRRRGASDRRSAARGPARGRMPLALRRLRGRPLAGQPRARWPPDPTVAPFLPLRTAPRRDELPAMIYLSRS